MKLQGSAQKRAVSPMPSFETSPRPNKRRKTTAVDSPITPPTSSVFQAVKKAVLGSSLSRGLRSRNISVLSGKETTSEKRKVIPDPPDETLFRSSGTNDNGASTPQYEDLAMPIYDEVIEDILVTEEPPTKLRGGRQEEAHLENDAEDGLDSETKGTVQTPTKRKRKRYRPRSGSQDQEESSGGFNAEEDSLGDCVGSNGHQPGTFTGDYNSEDRDIQKNDARKSTRLQKHIIRSPEEQSHGGNEEDVVSMASRPDNEGSVGMRSERPGVREPRRPRRNSNDMVEQSKIESTPTNTSTRKRGRPRKHFNAAAVSHGLGEHDLGFKDINMNKEPEKEPNSKKKEGEAVVLLGKTPIPNTISSTPRRKRGRPRKDVVDQQFPPHQPVLSTVAHVLPSHNSEKSLEDHAEYLQTVFQDDSLGLVTKLRLQIMEGLTGKRRLPLVNLDEEYQKVHQLVEQTVVAGEGNSMLVIGARGSAKTTLVETVVSDLAVDHREDFHVVRLNGFIHTDDKLALRETWRQLGREMEVEDDLMGNTSNYADILTSLLALLAYPPEIFDANQDHTTKSVVFILDEFDLFASHPRQTLLYNLFDIAQSRNAPIAVLGLTTKFDVVESLEKRVKSRFSQRYVHLSLPKTFYSFRDICKSALACQFSSQVPSRLRPEDTFFQTLHTAWTAYMTALFTHDSTLNALLQRIYALSKSVSSFLTASLLPISLLSPTHLLTGQDFASHTLSPPDSNLHVLPSLSDLELSLLIAAARLDIILDTDTCNFSLAYDEYQQLASRFKIQSSAAGQTAVGAGARVWGREVAMGAWERLAALDLIVPAGGGGKGEAGRAGRMWRVDVGLEEIAPCVSGMGAVMTRWCKEI
ncbi:hypothetical protein MMC12_002429 [Toensbergia leucococca]|nr:hypothetical protein [Toensbergia leucococca]